MNLKMEDSQAKKKDKEEEDNATREATEYEQMLQKLEAEVRNHIRVYPSTDRATAETAYRIRTE